MSQNYKMIAKTIFGFEDLLAAELKSLGATDIEKGKRMVSFTGDLGFMYKVNLASRTAIRIIKPIHEFEAFTEKELYDAIQKTDWSQYMDLKETFAIDTTVTSEYFTHSLYVAQKAKDAIADQFRDKYNERPSVDLKNPDLRINIHINEHQVSVALDSSGESLHKRGYRLATNEAPINEVLAAGLVMLSGWDGTTDFIDPMCGSGTILIEAAMIARNMAPNVNRENFAFKQWRDWDPALFETIRRSLLSKLKEPAKILLGYDIDPEVLEKAKENISRSGMEKYIQVEEGDFFKSRKTSEGPLHLLFNPPYNERIDINTENFYTGIGTTLKKNYPGTNAWFITANLDALKFVGLKASRRIEVANGQLEARLVKYEMYEGTRRTSFKNKDEGSRQGPSSPSE
jgi:putative N6-adenine-specific DNA methylase